MPKDSAASYEQKRWEFAANTHARCIEVLGRYQGRPEISYWHKRKLELEEEYPQLKRTTEQ